MEDDALYFSSYSSDEDHRLPTPVVLKAYHIWDPELFYNISY